MKVKKEEVGKVVKGYFAQVISLEAVIEALEEKGCEAKAYSICITRDGSWMAIRNEDVDRINAGQGCGK